MTYTRGMRKAIPILLFVVVAGLVALVLLNHRRPSHLPTAPPHSSAPVPSNSGPLAHVVVILEENKPASAIISSPDAPYINRLAQSGALAKNYLAVTHPSLPNYIALTSGTTAGITTDCNPLDCPAKVPNLVDKIERSGRSWKEYAESMPAPCSLTNSGEYAVRHDPFVYYPDIRNNRARCQSHVVPFSQLAHDLASTTSLPAFSFITPNVCNDMHDCSIQTGDDWLAREVPKLLHSPAFTKQLSLLVVIWDEGSGSNNVVPAIFAGSAAKSGYVSSAAYSHYSLLHTIEAEWHLAPLTPNDRSAPLMSNLLR